MRVKGLGRLSVEDPLGSLMSRQDGRRRLDRKKEAAKVVRFTGRRLESNLKRIKGVRQLFREVGKGCFLSVESSKQGEMRSERRAAIPSAQLGDHAGEPVVHRTRWEKPEMERPHKRCPLTYSTVTLFARFRGRSTSTFRSAAT